MFVLGYDHNFDHDAAEAYLIALSSNPNVPDEVASNLRTIADSGVVEGIDIGSEKLFFDDRRFSNSRFGLVEKRIDFSLYAEIDGTTFMPCATCGKWVSEFEADFNLNGRLYCDNSCAAEAGLSHCHQCGDVYFTEECIEIHGELFCSSACAEDAGYYRCARCGEWHESCGDSNYVRDYGDVCDECSGWFYWCDECECYVTESEYDDNGLCCRCSGGDFIFEYSYKEVPVFYGDSDSNSTPFIGVELETDHGDSRAAFARGLSEASTFNRFYLKSDGSLDNGVEIVTHPMTLGEHVNCGIWREVHDIAIENGFKSHDAGTCGIHAHVNRSFFGKSKAVQSVGGYKMMRLMQRFETQFSIFARRANSHWCEYTSRYDYDPKSKKEIRGDSVQAAINDGGVIMKANTMIRNEYGKYQALNVCHSDTFEIRIFRGTLKLSTIYATLAIVNGLARAAKSHGEAWIECVDWYTLINWIIADCDDSEARECLVAYCNEKSLLMYESSESIAA